MGLMDAPAMLMQIMKNLLVDMLDKAVVVLLNNELIYSTMVKKHFKLLEKVFANFYKHVFYCKLKKCSFLQKTTTFLGFDITPESMHISNKKLKNLKELPKPTTILKVQSFLGFE